jgi:hypothetical protein
MESQHVGSAYQIISGITLLTVITIAYGGPFVLGVTRGRLSVTIVDPSI